MASFADEKLTAQEDINEDGKDVVLSTTSGRAYDIEAGAYTSDTTISTTLKALHFPSSSGFNSGMPADGKFVSGGQTTTNQATIMIAGLDVEFEPDMGNKVLMDGVEWSVIGVSPFRPNDSGYAIYYDVTISR